MIINKYKSVVYYLMWYLKDCLTMQNCISIGFKKGQKSYHQMVG